jgi:hypothetical protein
MPTPPSGAPTQPSGPTQPTTTGSTPSGGAVDASRLAAFKSSWACADAPLTVKDLTKGSTMTCQVSISVSGSEAVVSATGIPNHDYESGGACCAKTQNDQWHFPLAPVNDTDGTLTQAPTRGAVAVAIDGAAIFGPEDADSRDVVAYTLGTCSACSQGPTVNLCMGHSTPDGIYHYHADANCVKWHPVAPQTWSSYQWTLADAPQPPAIIGWAFDGYPIYGNYGYADNGTVKEMTSSYQLKSGKSGAGGIADYDYVPGLGDLDQCNGKWVVTPEFPNGTYAYFSTRHNGAGANGFPYFLNCYHGVADSADLMPAR